MLPILPQSLTLPPRTLHGPGIRRELFNEARSFGARGFIVLSRSIGLSPAGESLVRTATDHGDIEIAEHTGGEPTLDHVEHLLKRVRNFNPDWIAAVGGGSVIDLAKAVSGLAVGHLPIERYHDGEPLPGPILPLIAMPTTAGTGSEATMVTVLINPRTGVKKSFRHPGLMPRSVILDPELLGTCSPAIIAYSGMDALVQAMESYVSKSATWLTDTMALKAIELISRSIETVHRTPHDVSPAGDLLNGSYLAGCALTNARLGLVHGLAHPLGARFAVPHGQVCAACVLPVLRFNRDFIAHKNREMESVLGESTESCFARLIRRLGIQSPFAGKPLTDRARMIEETLASGSTAANPRPVVAIDVDRILDEIFLTAREAEGKLTG